MLDKKHFKFKDQIIIMNYLDKKILAIDVGAKTGIAYYNGEGDFSTYTIEHKKSLTFKEFQKKIHERLEDWGIEEIDILLLEWQNDSWTNSNSKTQQVLQEKNYMWIHSISTKFEIEYFWIRKSSIIPLLKEWVYFRGVDRKTLKAASIAAFESVFNKKVSDDESDAYWFIKSFMRKRE